MIKYTERFTRVAYKLVTHLFLHITATALLLYIFSLLQNRIEFLIVCLSGLLYAFICSNGIILRIQLCISTSSFLLSLAQAQNKTTDMSDDAFSEVEKKLSEQIEDVNAVSMLDSVYMDFIKLICLYKLLRHLSGPFSELIVRLMARLT